MSEIIANGVALASPTKISINNETIWSSGTGRSASGHMSGDVIDTKKTYQVSWGILTQDEYNAIQNLPSGFFDTTILGTNLRCYRSSISSEFLGVYSDGNSYFNDVSTSFIEQ